MSTLNLPELSRQLWLQLVLARSAALTRADDVRQQSSSRKLANELTWLPAPGCGRSFTSVCWALELCRLSYRSSFGRWCGFSRHRGDSFLLEVAEERSTDSLQAPWKKLGGKLRYTARRRRRNKIKTNYKNASQTTTIWESSPTPVPGHPDCTATALTSLPATPLNVTPRFLFAPTRGRHTPAVRAISYKDHARFTFI